MIACGGFKSGPAIGETDQYGSRAMGRAYTPGNLLSNLYRHLGIAPATPIPDHQQRPMPVMDERELIHELI